jgi:hypothetical protein
MQIGKKEDVAIMLNKKNKILVGIIASLASLGMLSGCDSIVATPPADEYNQKILDNTAGDLNITNNTMKQIYDALVSEGDTNSEKILNNVLYIYSQSVFGDFFELKDAIDANDTTALQKIADNYSIYHDAEGVGQIKKVQNMYQDIFTRVKKVFYGYVTNSTYQVRSKFIEKKFYDAQTKANYELGSEYYTDAKQVYGEFRLDDSLTSTEIDGVYFKDLFNTYKNYIIINVLPDIYRDELVCQYLFTENYHILGNNYARKVDYIKLSANSVYPSAIKNLVLAYSRSVINTSSVDASVYNLQFLDRLSKGYFDFSVENAKVPGFETMVNSIYSEAGWTLFSASEISKLPTDYGVDFTKVAKESTLGGYVSSLIKIFDETYTNDSDLVKDFTNSGAYSIETGFRIKLQALEAVDNTKYGWYSSISDIPSDSSTRLFKIGVANEVDSDLKTGSDVSKGKYGYYCGKDAYRSYYLTPSTFEIGNDTPYAISDSGTFYIIKVNEAVKYSKLQSGSDTYYDVIRNEPYLAEKIARQVASTLSSSDNYKKLSNKYFVEKMAVSYHDTTVFDYFKKTFPDLFD